MKPLVNYCRWQRAKLRLRGRDDSTVWGELVFHAGSPEERLTRFRYELAARRITLEEAAGPVTQQLDEMGVIVTTSAGDAPQ